jgi:hypothetical protein
MMRASSAVLASVCAALLAGAGSIAAEPDALRGVWERVGVAEPSEQPTTIEVAGEVIKADGTPCSVEGLRAINERRWYVDARCETGGRSDLMQLDLVLLDDGRLMVARRILGTAQFYLRRTHRAIATERAS